MTTFRNSLQLIRNCFITILLFEAIYRLILVLVVTPICKLLATFAIRISVGDYLTNDNFLQFITNPIAVVLLLASLLLLIVYSVLEIAGVIICFSVTYHGGQIGVMTLYNRAMTSAARLFHPQNWWLLLFVLLILPLTSGGTASSILGSLTIPAYIQNVIDETPVLIAVLLALIAVANYLTLTFLLTFNVFFLDKMSVRNSAQTSRKLMMGHRFKFFVTILLLNLLVGALSIFIPSLILPLAYQASKLMGMQSAWIALFLGAIGVINALIQFALATLAVIIIYAPITEYYYRFRKQSNVPLPENKPSAETTAPERRWPIYLLVGFLGITILFEATLIYFTFHQTTDFVPQKMVIMGHRGTTVDAPGNTIAAIDTAIAQKADFSEIDVQLTKEGIVILTHDTNLLQVAGLDVNIYDLTLEEAQKIDVGSSFDTKFSGTKMPTLDEVIKHCKGKMKLNIEIKPNSKDKHFEEAVIAVIEANNFQNDCVVSSLSYDVIKEMKRLAPHLRTGLILTIGAGNIHELPDTDFLSMESTFITPTVLKNCRKNNKEVYAWTIDTIDEMKKMTDLKVDGVITGDITNIKATFEDQTSPTGRIRQLILGY